MFNLRKEYCTCYGRAQEAFRARAKPRGRPVTSDRPPPRRCGQAVESSCSEAAYIVNSEPHTGARLSVRVCVGPELFRCVLRLALNDDSISVVMFQYIVSVL